MRRILDIVIKKLGFEGVDIRSFRRRVPIRFMQSQPKKNKEELERNLGPQPLDALMSEYGLRNRDLVEAFDEPITHKMVSRGRKGRRLSANTKKKVARAFNMALVVLGESEEEKKSESPSPRQYEMGELFNY